MNLVMPKEANTPKADEPKSRPFPWRCPECGKSEVWPVTVRHTSQVRHDGRTYVVELPRLRVPQCAACGDLVFDNGADQQIAQALREQLGLLSAAQIRGNREELGLSQRQLAEHLGVSDRYQPITMFDSIAFLAPSRSAPVSCM